MLTMRDHQLNRCSCYRNPSTNQGKDETVPTTEATRDHQESCIHPVTAEGNRYILTLVENATRYTEAIPLSTIETERVTETLLDIFSRLDIHPPCMTWEHSSRHRS